MASLMAKVTDLGLLEDPHVVKVVADKRETRCIFPGRPSPTGPTDFFYQHIGIYAYRRNFLLALARLKPTRLERQEKLEQLRVLENGDRIKMIEIRSAHLECRYASGYNQGRKSPEEARHDQNKVSFS